MKLTKIKIKQIIKEEIANMLEERDALEMFFDRLEAVVYHSAQWQTVGEAQQAIQDIGEEAERLRAQ